MRWPAGRGDSVTMNLTYPSATLAALVARKLIVEFTVANGSMSSNPLAARDVFNDLKEITQRVLLCTGVEPHG